ncbi:MAG: substrate-binding domain-containing protein, partial [Filifactor alocis]|nr:substrate-binding domain-containing protein [Filifactor alocis]
CNPFFSQLIRGAEEDANKKGYDLIITNTDDDDEKLLVQLELMKKKMVDGLILISSQNSSIGELLDNINIPTVLVDRVVQHKSLVGRVEIDNRKGGYLATSHLIEKGCDKIVFLAGDIQTFSSYERYLGYKSALEDHGLEFDEALVEFGSFHADFGYNAVLSLLEKESLFNGIYASNDMIAVGAMQALKSCGYRIPEDIKVVGFDDIYLSALVTPTLTTVHQPVFEMGSTASKILINYLSDKTKKDAPVICFDTMLVERESTR